MSDPRDAVDPSSFASPPVAVIWEFGESSKITKKIDVKTSLPGNGSPVDYGTQIFYDIRLPSYDVTLKARGMTLAEKQLEELKCRSMNKYYSYYMDTGEVVTGFPTEVQATRITGTTLFEVTISVTRTDIKTILTLPS